MRWLLGRRGLHFAKNVLLCALDSKSIFLVDFYEVHQMQSIKDSPGAISFRFGGHCRTVGWSLHCSPYKYSPLEWPPTSI